ncbi:hypothetical protein [Streptomyces sp. NPDC058572]|uniref:hypothetical protein n=1 Tax=Streptomyces sp. NPDC058572 TaxID=3346546 RepID=UPI00365F0D9E
MAYTDAVAGDIRYFGGLIDGLLGGDYSDNPTTVREQFSQVDDNIILAYLQLQHGDDPNDPPVVQIVSNYLWEMDAIYGGVGALDPDDVKTHAAYLWQLTENLDMANHPNDAATDGYIQHAMDELFDYLNNNDAFLVQIRVESYNGGELDDLVNFMQTALATQGCNNITAGTIRSRLEPLVYNGYVSDSDAIRIRLRGLGFDF